MTLRRFSTLALVVVMSRSTAGAQESAPPDSGRARLDTVVITATREVRSLTQVPFAVSVVTAGQWSARSGAGIDQALAQIPGVLAQSRYGTHDIRLVIRGFGARGAGDRSNSGTSRGVRVVLDGIPETEPDGRTAFDQIDLGTVERVEVLRSNGSAAWGNAAGGVVSFTTMPTFERRYAELTQQAGSFGLLRTVARAAAGTGDRKAWLSLTRTTYGGWREHSDASRTQMVAGATSPLGARGRLGLQLAAASNLFRIPGPLTPAEYALDAQQSNPDYLVRDERRFNRLARLGVVLDHQLSATQDFSAMVFAGPKNLQRSERNTFRDFRRYHVGGSLAWGQRFSAAGLDHRVRAGGDIAYQDGAIEFHDLGPGATRGPTLLTRKNEGAQSAGIFIQDEVALGDRVSVLIGARFDDLAYFFRDRITPSLDASRRFTHLTPRGGITWRPAVGTTVYASYGAGVEIPAGNETDPPPVGVPGPVTALNPLLDPILSRTMEAGVRKLFSFEGAFLHTLFVDAAGYSTVVEGEPVPYNGGRFYLTAGEVLRRGLELALTGYLAGGFTSRAAVTLSRNRYERYVVDSTYLGVPGAVVVLDGNRVAGLPGRVVNVSLAWQPPNASWLSFEIGSQHQGRYFADDRNAVDVPDYTVWRAATSAERVLADGLMVRLQLSVENLTDVAYIGSAFINPDYVGGAPAVYETGLPRSLLLGLTFKRVR